MENASPFWFSKQETAGTIIFKSYKIYKYTPIIAPGRIKTVMIIPPLKLFKISYIIHGLYFLILSGSRDLIKRIDIEPLKINYQTN